MKTVRIELGELGNALAQLHAGHCRARDRDAQFQYIDENSRAFLKARQPVISCDINYARNWIMHGSNRAAGQMLDKSVIFGCEGRF